MRLPNQVSYYKTKVDHLIVLTMLHMVLKEMKHDKKKRTDEGFLRISNLAIFCTEDLKLRAYRHFFDPSRSGNSILLCRTEQYG